MHYDEVGQGRTVVVIHGWRLDASTEQYDYEPVFERLPGWRRLYLRLPGMGGEPTPDRFRSQDDLLRFVLDAVEEVMPPDGLVVAGTSNGANLARAVAHRLPDRIHGLLMRVPMLVADDAGRTLPKSAEAAAAPPAVHAARDAKLHAVWEPARRRADDDVLGEIRKNPSAYGLTDPTVSDAPFPKPTLIVTGRQDMTVGWADVVATLPLYPRASLAVLDRETHELPVVSHALFAALVTDWLERVASEWPA